MTLTIGRIQVDTSQYTVTFQGGYSPASGPLPTQIYTLRGLWLHDNVILKALFQAEKIPVHDSTPIFHRYESHNISQPGQAVYRYFTVPGFAGMILSQSGYTRVGLPIASIFHHLDEDTNRDKLEIWREGKTPEFLDEHTLIEVPDQLGTYPPTILVLAAGQTHV